jgi:hypothetical protein
MAGPIISKLLTDFFNEIGHSATCGSVRAMSAFARNSAHSMRRIYEYTPSSSRPRRYTGRSCLALILGAHTWRRGSSTQRFAGGIWALARLPEIKVATRCCFVRAVCFTRPFERGELRNQTSKSSQQRCASGWFAEASRGLLTAASPFDAAPTVAKAVSIVDNGRTKVAIRPTQAAAEIIAAILLIMTSSHS